jgi:hypothetical protein
VTSEIFAFQDFSARNKRLKWRGKEMACARVARFFTVQKGKIYQMTKNVPKCHKIYSLAIK